MTLHELIAISSAAQVSMSHFQRTCQFSVTVINVGFLSNEGVANYHYASEMLSRT